MIALGPTGAGFMWLLLFSIMAGVLLGFTGAVASFGLNLITVAGLSVLVLKKEITWTLLPENEIAIWAVKSVNFICINAIVAASIGFIIARIIRTAKNETRRRIRLDQEIQARIRTEKENKALTERLYQSQKMEAIGTLAGGIAHDFNNILSAITGHTELLLMEAGLPEQVSSSLTKINQAADKAKGITRQILTFGRQSQSVKASNDLGEITRECIELIKVGIPAGVHLYLEIQPGPFPIIGDKNQLFQVIMNLLTNGIQAMDGLPGSREKRLALFLAPMPDTLPRDRYGLSPDQSYLMLKVSDTGKGIAREHLNRIFDPYFTTKRKGMGTGLGLSITHSIVKDHGGEIWVDSTLVKGTGFTIVVPAQKQVHSAKPEKGNLLLLGNERILMVDDEPEVLEVHQSLLEHFGYRVEPVETPDAALEVIRDHPGEIDLVLIDQKMPGMTGDALGARIRSLCPDLPLVLCSGFPGEKTDYSDFQAVIPKPVTATLLAQTVRKVIDEG